MQIRMKLAPKPIIKPNFGNNLIKPLSLFVIKMPKRKKEKKMVLMSMDPGHHSSDSEDSSSSLVSSSSS